MMSLIITIATLAQCLLEAPPLRGAFGNSPEGYTGRQGRPQESALGVGLEPSRHCPCLNLGALLTLTLQTAPGSPPATRRAVAPTSGDAEDAVS